MKAKLTDPKASGYKAKPSRYDVSDVTVPDLKLRVNPSGQKSWVVRIWREKRYTSKTIGVFKKGRKAAIEMNTDEAREQARIELALVGRKGSLSQKEAILKAMPTLSEWFDLFCGVR